MKDHGEVEAMGYVVQYLDRTRLTKLGVTIAAESLPARTIDALLEIDRTLDTLREKESKKGAGKRG